MSALGDFLRVRFNIPKKYRLCVMQGDKAPAAFHEDGQTQWSRGKPVSYLPAINELQVGLEWIQHYFPAMVSRAKLTGQRWQLSPSDIELFHATMAAEKRIAEAQAWLWEHRRKPVLSLDEDEDRRSYAA